MLTVNKVTLIGNVGRDPETKETKGGSVTRISVATRYKEDTTWHNVSCFGKLSEQVAQYVRKGDPVYVEGRMSSRKTDKGTYWNVTAFSVICLRGKNEQTEETDFPV